MGADCCSDHELPTAKFRPKLKKVGKISRPFRYDLNQITYNYTREVADRFKGLDLIMDRGSWQCTGGSDQDKLQEKEMQKVKMVVWRCLTNSREKKRSKRQRRKGRYTHLNAESWRIVKRDKKAFLNNQCKEIEENKRMGKTRDLFRKIRDTKGSFHVRTGTIKTEMVWT